MYCIEDMEINLVPQVTSCSSHTEGKFSDLGLASLLLTPLFFFAYSVVFCARGWKKQEPQRASLGMKNSPVLFLEPFPPGKNNYFPN